MAEIEKRRPRGHLAIVGHPIYSMLFPAAIVCFVGALAADISYVTTEFLMWLNFSSWLLVAGLFFGLLAMVFLIIDFVRLPATHTLAGWAHLLLFIAAWLVELLNMLVHNRDGWTAVVPLGLTLSIVGVLLILVAGWLWRPVEAEAAR